jgi:predicted MFS family arabinose efflux permease
MGVFGQYLGGVLAEKRNLKRNAVILGGFSFPFILAMAFTEDVILLIAALFFFFFTFMLQPMFNTLMARYTALKMRATAFGIYFFMAFGVGSMAASFSGFIAQNFGLPWVFVGLSAGVLIMVALSLMLMRLRNPLKPIKIQASEKV